MATVDAVKGSIIFGLAAGRQTFIAEYEVVGIDSIRLQSDVDHVTCGCEDQLSPGPSTTHGGAALWVVAHVDSFQWLDDSGVPMTWPIHLAAKHSTITAVRILQTNKTIILFC